MEIPKWLAEGTKTSCPCCSIGVSKKKNFVERTLVGISALLEEAIFSEKYAKRDGLLQKLDPRVKLVTLLILLFGISFVRYTEIIIGVYVLTLFLAYFSKIEISFFIKRVWLFIPIFAGVIAIPALFNVITPGEPLLIITKGYNSWNIPEITITKPGLMGAILFVSRVATSVSLAVLITLTTRWTDLLKALHILRVPQMFVLVLGMTYRYIFLLIRIIQDMHLAKKSRTLKSQSTKKEQHWVASRIGAVIMKSLRMSENVHLAMISRGFRGEVKSMKRFKMKGIDHAWMLFSIGLTIAILLLNYLIGIRYS